MSRSRTRSVLLLAGATIVAGACTHTYNIRPGDRSNPEVINLEERGREQSGTLHRDPGDPIAFTSVELTPDAVVWVSPDRGTLREIPVDQADYIEFVDQRRGAVEGLAIGLGGGFLVGAIWAFATYDGEGSDPSGASICLDRCSKTEQVFATGLSGAFLGGLAGVTVGAVRGTRLRYHLVLGSP